MGGCNEYGEWRGGIRGVREGKRGEGKGGMCRKAAWERGGEAKREVGRGVVMRVEKGGWAVIGDKQDGDEKGKFGC